MQGEYFKHADATEISEGHQALRVLINKRAIVHAHAVRRTGVKLRSWCEGPSGKRIKRYEIEDEEHEAILENMGQLF